MSRLCCLPLPGNAQCQRVARFHVRWREISNYVTRPVCLAHLSRARDLAEARSGEVTTTEIPLRPPRYVFLDFDGVLNSRAWCEERPSRQAFAKEWNISPEMFTLDIPRWQTRSIDPKAVQRLNRLGRESGARFVVSSTWRTMFSISKLQWMLNERGFEHMLVGATPDMTRDADGTQFYRGDQIAAWMLLVDATPEQIVILDDDSDMSDLMHRLVNTNHDVGLTDADVDRALELLDAPR